MKTDIRKEARLIYFIFSFSPIMQKITISRSFILLSTCSAEELFSRLFTLPLDYANLILVLVDYDVVQMTEISLFAETTMTWHSRRRCDDD